MPSRRSPAHTRPTPDPAAAHLPPLQTAAWAALGQAGSGLWHGVGLGLDLQQQCARRWALRQQEMALHWPVPGDLGSWVNAYLAGMRWGLQESQQSFQDLMSAPLQWRGELGREPVDPLLATWNQLALQQMQAWTDFWADAGRQRSR